MKIDSGFCSNFSNKKQREYERSHRDSCRDAIPTGTHSVCCSRKIANLTALLSTKA